MKKFFSLIVALAVLVVALANSTRADYIVGHGPAGTPNSTDSGYVLGTDNSLVMDRNAPLFLPAGTYQATSLSFKYNAYVFGSDIQPYLAVVTAGSLDPADPSLNTSGLTLNVVAAGSHDIYTSTAGIDQTVTTAFGGSNTFTIPSGGEIVYAGYTSLGVGATSGDNNIGGENVAEKFSYNALVTSGLTLGPAPVLFDYNGYNTTYSFSIDVIAVPEPTSCVLLAVGSVAMLLAARRRVQMQTGK